MIFCSKNEDGVPAHVLIQEGRKTVTRRLKPVVVGSILAVQPGRGKKAVAHIRVKNCLPNNVWLRQIENESSGFSTVLYLRALQCESEREGFRSWWNLLDWFEAHGIQINKTFRIEFELLAFCDVCKQYFRELLPGSLPSIICPVCVKEARKDHV